MWRPSSLARRMPARTRVFRHGAPLSPFTDPNRSLIRDSSVSHNDFDDPITFLIAHTPLIREMAASTSDDLVLNDPMG
jgi:hypothetical protein